MKTSHEMVQFIASFEGLRLKAYKCPAGVWTIGYGHTGKDVHEGMVIDEHTALELLRKDLVKAETEADILSNICYIGQYRYDAIVSFIFNCGSAGFRRSTLRKMIISNPNNKHITRQFAVWNKITDPKTKQKVASAGLTRRRSEEAAWYFYGSNWKQKLAEQNITDVVKWASM